MEEGERKGGGVITDVMTRNIGINKAEAFCQVTKGGGNRRERNTKRVLG